MANFPRKWQIGLFTILSGILYIGAVQIFFRAAGSNGDNLWLGGFLAGAFGAFTLALLTKFMSKTSLSFSNELRSTLVGAITGIVFVRLLLPVAFAIWQIPVAWCLTTSIQPSPNGLQGISENAHS